MAKVIVQAALPEAQRRAAAARLPAMQPVAPGALLCVDDAYAAQLEAKAALIAKRRRAVVALLPGAGPAASELLRVVLEELARRSDFAMRGNSVTRPDGQRVRPNHDDPLLSLSRLVQEDLCILEKPGGGSEHVLTAALLGFPAGWTLAEKIGRPLTRIHAPVAPYDNAIAVRVQRLFDGIRPGAPLWRANLLSYDDPALFQPHPEAAPRRVLSAAPPWLRSERQTLFRLPETGAVVFAIHTTVVRAAG